jgi:TRAP-type C4-dicarboxylate transport system substrate-binding protein
MGCVERNRWLLGFTFLFFVFSALAVPQQSHAQVVQLRYSNFFPAPQKHSILAEQWCKDVEKVTNGKVKVKHYPGSTLTPPTQTYDSVVKGIADIGLSIFGYTMGKFPIMTAIDLPLGYKSGYVATKLINAYYNKFKPKELDEVKVMYLHAHGPGFVNTKKPVNKLEDMKGLKLRATGQTAQLVKALGGAPVAMPISESYDALSRGVVDGILCPFDGFKVWKLDEVVGNTTRDFDCAYSTGFFVVMNKDKWNSIPPDAQAAIEKLNQEYIEKQGKLWDEIDKEGYDLTKQRGNKVIDLPPEEMARWVKAARPVIDEYIKVLKNKGLPGEEAIGFMQDYLKKNDKAPF